MYGEHDQRPSEEKRRHPRVNTSNYIEYRLFDENENTLDRGEGQTLDLSQGGALLETERPLQGAFVVLTIPDLEGNTVQIQGRVANTRKPDNSRFYRTGVEFTGAKDEPINDIIAFVKTYNRSRKVLIIDDEPSTRTILERILRKDGFQTWQAQNGKVALEKIRSVQPDLIISDILMPELDGFELITKLRETPETQDIPFIFLSVKDDPVDQLKGFRMGANEYLVKPFTSAGILDAVKRVMEKADRIKGLREDVDISGSLGRIGLIEVVQIIEFNDKTGELFLLTPSGRVTGAVYINQGQVVNAVSGNLDGEEAFYDLSVQTDGFFKFHIRETLSENKIRHENMGLLMEASRLLDEAATLRSLVSAMDARLVLTNADSQNAVNKGVPTDARQRILDLVRDGKTVQEIITGAGLSRPRVAALLSELINSSVISEKDILSGG